MANKVGRKLSRRSKRKQVPTTQPLAIEPLEPRLLLDVAGWWDELGWRSASGGGVSYDLGLNDEDTGELINVPGCTQLVKTNDGDPVAIWIEGTLNEYVDMPVPFNWTVTGNIYARQYAGDDLGWADLSYGSGDGTFFDPLDPKTYDIPINATTFFGTQAQTVADAYKSRQDNHGDPIQIGTDLYFQPEATASELAAASGPNGMIVVAWTAQAIPTVVTTGITGLDTEIYAKMWTGTEWVELANSARGGGVSNDGAIIDENPDVTISNTGEIFISYTAIHPITKQREIVVKKFGYDYGDTVKPVAPPTSANQVWVELAGKFPEGDLNAGEDVGLFGVNNVSGVSRDPGVDMNASIAIDTDGYPIVAWGHVLDSSNVEIYVRKWNGVSWTSFGAESDQDINKDARAGVSNDKAISVQADIAVAENGDVYVTWVNWSDWKNYQNAGIFVKVLEEGQTSWQAAQSGVSTTGSGLAADLGWYYNPKISITENAASDAEKDDYNVLITWQGFAYDEKYYADRDNTDTLPDDEQDEHTPNLPGNLDLESPIMAIYASKFDGSTFELLYNSDNDLWYRYTDTWTLRESASPANNICWMPTAMVGDNGELVIAYTWRDVAENSENLDDEIYAQRWDEDRHQWIPFGQGGNLAGNEIINVDPDFDDNIQLAVIDFDGDPSNELDVLMADGTKIYLFNRHIDNSTEDDSGNDPDILNVEDGGYEFYLTDDEEGRSDNLIPGTWSAIAANYSYGLVYDLRGEPEVEYGEGLADRGPLLAWLDNADGTPHVAEWKYDESTGINGWVEIGDNSSAAKGAIYVDLDIYGQLTKIENTGISVQAGPDYYDDSGVLIAENTILLVYIEDDEETVIARFWDGTQWRDWDDNAPSSTGGVLPSEGPLMPAYYADFDGFNFEDDNISLEDVGWTTDMTDPDFGQRDMSEQEYNVGSWYFVQEPEFGADLDPNQIAFMDRISAELNDYAGVYGQEAIQGEDGGDPGVPAVVDPGISIVFDIEINDNGDDDDPADPTTLEVGDTGAVDLTGELDYNFELVTTSYVTVEFDYAFTKTVNLTGGAWNLTFQVQFDGLDENGDADTHTVTIDLDNVAVAYGDNGHQTLDSGHAGIDIYYPAGNKNVMKFIAILHAPAKGILLGSNEDDDPAQARLNLDNIAVYQRIVSSDDTVCEWVQPTTTPPGDTVSAEGNDSVGPDPNENSSESSGTYDFGAFLKATVADGAGYEEYTIEDITQWTTGNLVVQFRARLIGDNWNDDPFTVFVTDHTSGDYVGFSGSQTTSGPVVPDEPYTWYFDSGWWNGYADGIYDNDIDPDYAWYRIVFTDVPESHVDVTIQMNDQSGANSYMYIDDLSVLSTQHNYSLEPMAMLLPNLNFAVAVTTLATSMPLYYGYDGNGAHIEDASMNPYPATHPQYDEFGNFQRGAVISGAGSSTGFYYSGFYSSHILEFDIAEQDWSIYGSRAEATTSIDYLGFAQEKNFQEGTEDVSEIEGLGGYLYGMPSNLLYRLGDLSIGPNSTVWIALERVATDFVDWDENENTGDAAGLDRFIVHPWERQEPPGDVTWTVPYTPLDFVIWYWNPFIVPPVGDSGGQLSPAWIDANLVHLESAHAYTDVQIVGSNGQLPTAAWTNRGPLRAYDESYAQRYEGNGVWGVLNTESVQNDQFWSSLVMRDLITKPDGYPIAAFYMRHTDFYGIREFRYTDLLPVMVVNESSGTANDNVLEFGSTIESVVDRSFTIRNTDNNAPLIIYGIEIGGLGSDEGADQFTLKNAPEFPYILQPGKSLSVAVRFNPDGLDPDTYSSVIVVRSNAVNHPTHDFTGYYELTMDATVLSESEIAVAPQLLSFGNTNVTTQSSPMLIEVRHDNVAEAGLADADQLKLTIREWFFDGTHYQILSASIYDASTNSSSTRSVSNGPNYNDDVILDPGDILRLQVVFLPDDMAIFSETLYILSNDSDEPVVPVALTGTGISGSDIAIYRKVDYDLNKREEITSIEFGSVLMGGTASEQLYIVNEGSTLLTLSEIINPENLLLSVTPQIEEYLLSPGAMTTITVTYAPPASNVTDPDEIILPVELGDGKGITLFVFSDDPDESTYTITVTGMAVPLRPIIEVTEIAISQTGIDSDFTDGILEFGTLNLSQTFERQFKIDNIGGADLTVKSIKINSLNSPFIIVDPIITGDPNDDVVIKSFNDPQYQSMLVTVRYAPSHASIVGVDQFTVTVSSDAQLNKIKQVVLVGSAVDPQLVVTDDETVLTGQGAIDFGSLGKGLESTYTVTLTNDGASDLTVYGWTLTDGDPNVFDVEDFGSSSIVLAPEETRTISVTFIAADIDVFEGTLTITSNAPQGVDTVALKGTVVQAGTVLIHNESDSVDDLHINFTQDRDPLIYDSDRAVASFYITNTGSSSLTIRELVVESGTSSPFAIYLVHNGRAYTHLDLNTSTDDIPLAYGQSQLVTVTFAPATYFNGTDTLTIITSSDPDNPADDVVTEFYLSGETYQAVREIGSKKETVTFGAGESVTIQVSGSGIAKLVQDESSGSDIYRIELIGTNQKSQLKITGPRNGVVTIGQISGDLIKNITLKNVTMNGDGLDINMITGSLQLGDLINGADVVIDNVASRGLVMQVGNIGAGSDLRIDGNVKSVKVNGTQMAGNLIVDGDINSITAKTTLLTGAINADNINRVLFNDLNGAAVSVSGEIKNFTINQGITDSLISAGYDLGSDGRLGGTGSAADTLFSGGYINTLRVRGLLDGSTIAAGIKSSLLGNFFDPLATADGSINRLQFGGYDPNNGGTPFGVAAGTEINSVKIGNQTITNDNEDFHLRIF